MLRDDRVKPGEYCIQQSGLPLRFLVMGERETVRITVDVPKELHRAIRLWAIEASPADGAVVKLSEITRVLFDRLTWDRELTPWVATEIQRRAATRC